MLSYFDRILRITSTDRRCLDQARRAIEFAAADSVDLHGELARDFLSRILSLNLDACFISDESSLWDFNDEETNERYYKKIILLYGVDVSDVQGEKLSQIFERIALIGGLAKKPLKRMVGCGRPPTA